MITSRACVTAARGPDGLTDLQYHIWAAHIPSMTGIHVNPDYLEPMGPEEFAEAMRYRDKGFRIRMVEVMLLTAFVLDPVPYEVIDRIGDYARELSVDVGMIQIARDQCKGARVLVDMDSARAGYSARNDPAASNDRSNPSPTPAPPTPAASTGADATADATTDANTDAVIDAVIDPALAARWESLGDLAPSTLGRKVWEFYRSRGYRFPGTAGSASPYLAQHDWIHVLAEYGTTVESEVEVFGLISRANDDPAGFALLAMSISLFQSGTIGANDVFGRERLDLTRNSRKIGIRLADAMYRGAIVAANFGGQDLLAVDWMSMADRDIDEVRSLMGLPAKSFVTLEHGSVGPWDEGGITSFQLSAGRSLAAELGEAYDSFGASVAGPERGTRKIVVSINRQARASAFDELEESGLLNSVLARRNLLRGAGPSEEPVRSTG